MIAYKICLRVKQMLEDELTGRVHSVFNQSFNIITMNHQLVTVLSNEKSIAPFSILLLQEVNFIGLGIIQGMDISFSAKNIKIRKSNQVIHLKKAHIWNPSPEGIINKDNKENLLSKIKCLEDGIYNYGNLKGIAPVVFNIGEDIEELKTFYSRDIPLDAYNLFIYSRLLKFIQIVIKKDIENVSQVVHQIIGFGRGLTPSIDDFISGLMIAFFYLYEFLNLDIGEVDRFNAKIIKDISKKTTVISENMLKASSYGEASEVVRELMVSILSATSNTKITYKLQQVINIGHTSGTDLLCGIYIGFRIVLRYTCNRRVLIHEKSS